MNHRKEIYIALIISLSINLIILVLLNETNIYEKNTQESLLNTPIDVELVEVELLEILPTLEHTMEDRVEEKLNALISNMNAEKSQSKKSFSESQKAQMNESVEAQVRATEARLKAEASAANPGVDFDKPKDVTYTTNSDSGEGNTSSYEGNVAVAYNLPNPNRSHKSLPIPAYRCESGGTVTINIVVDYLGNVVQTSVNEGMSDTQDNCLRSEALKYANISKFKSMVDAPKKHQGTITYTFERQ